MLILVVDLNDRTVNIRGNINARLSNESRAFLTWRKMMFIKFKMLWVVTILSISIISVTTYAQEKSDVKDRANLIESITKIKEFSSKENKDKIEKSSSDVFLPEEEKTIPNEIPEENLQNETDQNKTPRFEIGLHYSNFNFGVFDPIDTKEFGVLINRTGKIINQDRNEVESGIGARFTYNFNKNIGIETEANWYPRIVDIRPLPLPPGAGVFQGGQKFQMVFGPKIGYRNKKFGVFGKARPGFMHFVEFPMITFLVLGTQPGSALSATGTKRATFFNIDLGGVFEYYPSRRTVIRFDMGDTIIRYTQRTPRDTPSITIPGYTRHNLQFNIGAGFRF